MCTRRRRRRRHEEARVSLRFKTPSAEAFRVWGVVEGGSAESGATVLEIVAFQAGTKCGQLSVEKRFLKESN